MAYSEMAEAAEKVAAWLRSHGVVPDCVVALQLHRSLEQVVGVVGALLSGGSYLPLDPKWPLERRRFMVEDVACKQLVAQYRNERQKSTTHQDTLNRSCNHIYSPPKRYSIGIDVLRQSLSRNLP